MQAQTRGAVEDLDDLTVAVARLEATADALDARLTSATGAAGAAGAAGTQGTDRA